MDAVELAATTRHSCKVCGKGFPCGRSLGGHMRSHLSLGGDAVGEVEADDELKRAPANSGRSSNGAVGYGLRENPKKTRRLSDFADEEEDGDGEHKACRECGKLFASWRSLFGHMRCHASGGRDHDEEEDVDVEEEFDAEQAEAEEDEKKEMVEPMESPAAVTVMAAAPRRRRRSMRVAAPAPAPPPAVPSGFDKEPEDVALCLLMLSRDTGLWSSPVKEDPFEKEEQHKKSTKHVCLPRNGDGYNSDDDSALLQYGDAKIKNSSSNDVAKSKKRRTSYYATNSNSSKQQCEVGETKRTKYECPGCGKVFNSYQALGGHRASHKRINTSCSAPKVAAAAAAPEPSVETYPSFSTLSPSASPDSVVTGIGDRGSGKAKKAAAAAVEKFECPVCFRVFASGQALGGHKRSHVMAAAASSDDGEFYASASGNADQEHSMALAGFLDLNLPAPSEEA